MKMEGEGRRKEGKGGREVKEGEKGKGLTCWHRNSPFAVCVCVCLSACVLARVRVCVCACVSYTQSFNLWIFSYPRIIMFYLLLFGLRSAILSHCSFGLVLSSCFGRKLQLKLQILHLLGCIVLSGQVVVFSQFVVNALEYGSWID